MILRWLGLVLTIAALAYVIDTSVVAYVSTYPPVHIEELVLEEALLPPAMTRHTVAPDRAESTRPKPCGYCQASPEEDAVSS